MNLNPCARTERSGAAIRVVDPAFECICRMGVEAVVGVRNCEDCTLISNSHSLQERVILNQVLGILGIGAIGG
jgi:hypothetical protein